MKLNRIYKYIYVCVLIMGATLWSHGQNFNESRLSGTSSNNLTSLQLDRDGRLYVAQQNGEIKAFTENRDTDKSPDPKSFKEAILGNLGSQSLGVTAQDDSDPSIKI